MREIVTRTYEYDDGGRVVREVTVVETGILDAPQRNGISVYLDGRQIAAVAKKRDQRG